MPPQPRLSGYWYVASDSIAAMADRVFVDGQAGGAADVICEQVVIRCSANPCHVEDSDEFAVVVDIEGQQAEVAEGALAEARVVWV